MPILESTDYLLYGARPIVMDRKVDHNRPDIVLIDKQQKRAHIIDITSPLMVNLSKTEVEKVSKYENLAIEIKHIWELNKLQVTPFIISGEAVISKQLKKDRNN